MIKQSIYKGWCFLLALCLVACQQESMTEVAKGAFTIALADDTLGVQTKAHTAISEELAAKFQLTIRNAAGYTIYDGGYTSDPIPAPNGQYTLEARMGQNPDLAWEAPYYVGRRENVTVTAKETTSVAIPCTVGNAMVSACWTNQEKIDMVFTNYGLKVTVNRTSALLTPERGNDKLYLKAGEQVSFYFVGTLISTGVEQIVPLQSEQLRSTLNPADHCILTLTVNDRLAMQIEKAEIKQETINETIPLEWLPKPKVNAVGFSANRLAFYETETPTARLELNLASALQEMAFQVNFADEQYNHLNGDYTLSELTAEQREVFETAGLRLPTIGQQADASIDLTDLVAKFHASDAGTVTNSFTLQSLKANNREIEGALLYTIETQKPQMQIALPDYAVWSKQFTIDPCSFVGGTEETLRNGLKYQYQLEGSSDWLDCNEANQQRFEQQPTTKNFKVRAIYRNALTSNIVDGTLETQAQTPNANMDEWTSTTRQARVSRYESYNQPYFYPWITESNHWWDTNTLKTMPSSITSCLINTDLYPNLRSFPTATYENLSNGNKAAIVRTISVNDGNTSGTSLGSNIRGILFAGTADGSGNMTEGRPWSSRPTALTFQAKYNSYDNERFGIYVELYNEETLIANGSLLSVNGESITAYTAQTVLLNYVVENLKATSIRIRFCSVAEGDKPAIKMNKEVYLPTGNRHAHAGSELYIDNIQLIYDK